MMLRQSVSVSAVCLCLFTQALKDKEKLTSLLAELSAKRSARASFLCKQIDAALRNKRGQVRKPAALKTRAPSPQ